MACDEQPARSLEADTQQSRWTKSTRKTQGVQYHHQGAEKISAAEHKQAWCRNDFWNG